MVLCSLAAFRRRAAAVAVSLLLGCGAALGPRPAWAGYLQVKDGAGLFTREQAADLRDKVASFPFDVRVVTTGSYVSRNGFERYVSEQVESNAMVVIGLDPVQRRTSVHYGKEVRIAPSAYRAIEEAGSPRLRVGDSVGGVMAILERAAAAAAAPPEGTAVAGRRPGSALVFGVAALLAMAGGTYAVAWALRRRSVRDAQ